MKRLEFILLGFAVMQGLLSYAQTVENGPVYDTSLGARHWSAITNGLVFVDGEYLPPPYTITRKEADIFINGRCVDTGLQWPPRKRQTSNAPETDIALPSSITKMTTKYDSTFINYVNYKKDYLINKYGQQKGVEMMAEVYRELPCVAEAHFNAEDPNCITVIWITGQICNITQVPPRRKEVDLTVDQATQYVDKLAEIYVRGLSVGDYFMEGNKTMRGTKESYARVLQPLADLLRSHSDEKDFITAARTSQQFSSFSDKVLRSFFKHKGDLPKWEQRIKKDVKDASGNH